MQKEAGISEQEWEQQLIEGCRKNERQAQSALYQRYARKMYGVLLRYAKNRHDAEDWLQEGFVTVFKQLHTYRGDGAFGGWIRRIMINTALMAIRKELQWQEVALDEGFILVGEELPLNNLVTEEILSLLQKLPAGYRTVFNLYAIEGFSHAEIAALLNISENTSKSQYSRAKEHLRKLYTLFFEQTHARNKEPISDPF